MTQLGAIFASILVMTLPSWTPGEPPPARPAPSVEGEGEAPILFERDRQERMTIPVTVASNEYRFMVDTGAEQSAISSEIAGEMGFRNMPSRRVVSFGGERIIPAVNVPSVEFSDKEMSAVSMLTLSELALGSDGIIGIDQLDRQQVTFDFEASEMRIAPSPRRTARERGSVSIDLSEKAGRLVVSEARYERRRLDVILDTGSSITIGNAALMEKIPEYQLDQFLDLNMLTVTGDVVAIRYGEIKNVQIGKMTFETFPVAFAEGEPFDRLGMTEKPAIILGMDVLRTFGTMTIDFRRKNVMFTARQGAPLKPRDYWNIGSVVRQGTPRGRLSGG